jgi:adenylate cyclase
MVNMATDAIERGPMTYRDGRWQVQGHIDSLAARVPVGLKAMIGHRIATLRPADRRTLEVASVVGDEFAVADLAAALRKSIDTVEATCSRLATEANFVVEVGVAPTPDGSVSGRYRFLHALYRRVLYDEIGAAHRVRLHRAIGNHQAKTMGPRAAEHAAQLAMHFTHGHDYPRALEFHELAGFAALERQAAREAAAHFTAALDALGHVPELPSSANSELRIVSARATLSMALNGYAAPDTERDFARARKLTDGLADRRTVHPVLRGLLSFHHVRAELADAYELGERLLQGAESMPTDDCLHVQAHYGHGATLFHQGALAGAEMHLTAALTAYRPGTHAEHARIYGGYDPGVGASMWLAWTLALQGRLTEAVERDRAGLALARSLPYPFSLAWACYAASVSKQLFGDWAGSAALATEAVAIADEHGFPYVLGMATVNRGWAQVMQGKGAEGVALLRSGVAAVEATGARLVHPSYLGMLAAADAILGDRAAARRGFDAALAELETSGEGVHEAALLIGKSRFLAAGGVGGRAPRDHASAAEACLRRALEVARGQGAKLLELRAALALARHIQARGTVAQARRSLESVWPWFADQPALTPEVGAARRLLTGQDI